MTSHSGTYAPWCVAGWATSCRRAARIRHQVRRFHPRGSSLEAVDGAQGLGQALAASVPTVHPYLAHKGASFGDLVAGKRNQRLEVAP